MDLFLQLCMYTFVLTKRPFDVPVTLCRVVLPVLVRLIGVSEASVPPPLFPGGKQTRVFVPYALSQHNAMVSGVHGYA